LDNESRRPKPPSEIRAQIRESVDNEQAAVSRTDLLLLQHPGVWVRDEYRVEPCFERRIDVGLGAVADHPRTAGLHLAFCREPSVRSRVLFPYHCHVRKESAHPGSIDLEPLLLGVPFGEEREVMPFRQIRERLGNAAYDLHRALQNLLGKTHHGLEIAG